MELCQIAVSTKTVGTTEIATINARELHAFLEVQTQFNHWITRRIEKYAFVEGVGFWSILAITSDSDGNPNGRPSKEYYLTLDTAKQLAMVEDNEKGLAARKYFIECEERYRAVAHEKEYLPEKIAAIKLAGEFVLKVPGVKPGIAVAAVLACIKTNTGADMEDVRRVLPPMEQASNNTLNATQLGEKYGVSAVAMNKLLAGAGFQERIGDKWDLTGAGFKWAEKFPYERNGHSGYQILWNAKVLAELEK